MFRKKFNQLMAAALAVTMLLGEGRVVNAADLNADSYLEDAALENSASDASSEEISLDEPEDETENDESVEDAASAESSEDEASKDASDNEDAASEASSEDASEDASSECSSEDAAAEASSEDAAAEASSIEIELPEGLVGMGEDYEFTDLEKEMKELTLDNKDEYMNFLGLTEGVDYAKDEVVFLSEDKEHAKEVAEAFGGELKSFDENVAVIDLSESELGVAEACAAAFDKDIVLPVVSPNYIRSIDDPIRSDITDTSNIRSMIVPDIDIIEEPEDEEAVEETEDAETSEDAEAEETAADEESSEEVTDEADAEESLAAAYDEDEEVIEVEEDEENLIGTSSRVWVDNYTTLFKSEPGLNPTNSQFQWFHDMIGSYDAWASLGATGLAQTANVTVAVIDCGVQTDHPELNASGDGASGDHGTHVAGLVGARINGAGGAGVAPGVKINSYQTTFSDSDITAKIRSAVDGGADIINMSLGGPGYNPAQQAVLNYAYKKGVTVVVSMGNENSNFRNYPAAYSHVIAVGSVNETGKRSDFSTFGSWCDISAPGSNIWSTSTGSGYTIKDGTSMAAPIVSGACALFMAKSGGHKSVSPAKMESVLKSTATRGAGSGMGSGIVNVAKLVGAARAPKKKVKKETISKADAAAKVTIGSVTLNNKAVEYKYYYEAADGKAANAFVQTKGTALSVASVKANDKKKTPITTGVTYEWVSSNKNVVTVTGNGATPVITVLQAGSAKITCKAKTASMKAPKTATCTVTVKSNKVVSSITMLGKDGKAVKSVGLWLGTAAADASTVVTAKQLKADKKTVVAATPNWTSSNTKVATVSNGTIVAVGKGTATITAAAKDGSGKKASVTVTVKKAVTSIALSSTQKYVIPGGSVKVKAVVDKTASSKKLKWTVSGVTGAKVSNGSVKIPKNATVGSTITVTATATDKGGKYASIAFAVKPAPAKVQVSASKVTLGVVQRGSILKSTTVSASAMIPQANKTYAAGDTALVWKTSNSKVAAISQSGNNVVITAGKKGTATLTVSTQDGSGKKATVKVSVVTPVASLKLAVANGQDETAVATGGTLKFKAVVGNTYGTPSNKKVKWSYTILGYKASSSSLGSPVAIDAKTMAAIKKNKAFFSFSNGKIKANTSKKMSQSFKKYLPNCNAVGIQITATAADGSGCTATKNVMHVVKRSSFGFPAQNRWGLYLGIKNKVTFTQKFYVGDSVALPVYQVINGKTAQVGAEMIKVTSSNPSVASACYDYTSDGYRLCIYGYKKGSAKITLATTDGSKKKATLSLKVRPARKSVMSSLEAEKSELQMIDYVIVDENEEDEEEDG
ncbi:MAG: S8 family serine peptidase [Butyrivibrio sp.]|nr:S8 family serine peptidase [Butyrivibrio sp.]